MTDCLVGMPKIAQWMEENHPTERLAEWKCRLGTRAGKDI